MFNAPKNSMGWPTHVQLKDVSDGLSNTALAAEHGMFESSTAGTWSGQVTTAGSFAFCSTRPINSKYSGAVEITPSVDKAYSRFTATSQIAISGFEESDFPELVEHFQRFMKTIEKKKTAIVSSSGCGNCKYGIGDTSSVVRTIGEMHFNEPLPAKCKIAIAGCSRCCTMPFVRDVGLIPSPHGWKLIFGGNGGGKPRIGDIIAENVQERDLLGLVYNCLQIYGKYAQPKQRTSRFMEEFGVERFKKELFSK
jgi:NAD(P)H-nitrite reductase large subunit